MSSPKATPRCHPNLPLVFENTQLPLKGEDNALESSCFLALPCFLFAILDISKISNQFFASNFSKLNEFESFFPPRIFAWKKVTDVDLFSAKDYPQSPEVWPGWRRTHGGTPKKNVRMIHSGEANIAGWNTPPKTNMSPQKGLFQ